MCAIAGLISSDPRVLARIQDMARLQRHRGPDDEGYLLAGEFGARTFSGPDTPDAVVKAATPYRPGGRLNGGENVGGARLVLGHRRLSILDLSPLGHQPMSYRDRYWIVYNGEVYNYVELRAELEGRGHRLISHCDTEVILAAYSEWGADGFSKLNGMWAMAIYDAQTRELIVARSRFGVKPLYYWCTEELFAFASEIKAFTCLRGWQPRVNGQAVHDFLVSGLQDHSSETMFEGVWQLEPGSYARIQLEGRDDKTDGGNGPLSPNPSPLGGERGAASSRRLLQTKWFHLEPRPFGGTFADAAGQFRDRLIDSVRLRLRSDVPVGSCLSGGLDSSSIVCATSTLLKSGENRCAHKTFSACSEIKRYDERQFIEPVVAATGVQAHYVFPSHQDLFNELDRVTWHQDEPFAGTSIYAQWCVMKKAAAEGIRVMLDGQGADELLCGYPDFRRAFLCGLLRAGQPALAWHEAQMARGSWSGALSAVGRAALDAGLPMAAQRRFRQARRRQHPPPWLNRENLGASFPGRLAGRFRRYQSARAMSLELLAGAHLQMLLHWEDRNSMAHSVESRVPFLDFRLAEFTTGLPDHFKIRNGLTKAVLREGMKGIVPAAVLERRDKMGFVTPESVWATQTGAAEFKTRVRESIELCRGIITPEAATLLDDTIAGRRAYEPFLWRIICLGAWVRLFKVKC